MGRLWNLLKSLDTGIVLMAGLCLVMGVGSFFLSGERAASINGMPLLQWLRDVSLSWSWWLWVTLSVLVLLVVNTVCCSLDSLWQRWTYAGIMRVLAPQLIHLGFLLIVLAHGISAYGGFSHQFELFEGEVARLPDGRQFGLRRVAVNSSPMGMPTGFSGVLATDLNSTVADVTIRPNVPWLSGGYGVYIKQAEVVPYRRALLEVHREPGAGAALAGALLFTAGNLMVLYYRSRKREVSPMETVS